MEETRLRAAVGHIREAHEQLGAMLRLLEEMIAGAPHVAPAARSASDIAADASPAPARRLGTPSGAVKSPAVQAALDARRTGRLATLPNPLTKGPGARPDLSEETRAASLPELVRLAKGVIKMVGKDSPQLRPGLNGQAALNHVPVDDTVFEQALQQALRES